MTQKRGPDTRPRQNLDVVRALEIGQSIVLPYRVGVGRISKDMEFTCVKTDGGFRVTRFA